MTNKYANAFWERADMTAAIISKFGAELSDTAEKRAMVAKAAAHLKEAMAANPADISVEQLTRGISHANCMLNVTSVSSSTTPSWLRLANSAGGNVKAPSDITEISDTTSMTSRAYEEGFRRTVSCTR